VVAVSLNHEKLGWALIGFEDRHVWHAPFGYYDANHSSEPSQ